MSNQYIIENNKKPKSQTSAVMRKWCQRPGKKDEHGNILYFTEQSHKRETDVNLIIKKYDKTGLIDHVSRFEAKYGDMTGLDFKTAQDLVTNARSSFETLPADIKKRFKQNPKNLLEFMEDPNNRKEAIELGLIHPSWTEETDGLGEHVKAGENVIKTEDPTETTE